MSTKYNISSVEGIRQVLQLGVNKLVKATPKQKDQAWVRSIIAISNTSNSLIRTEQAERKAGIENT